ncbi:MAG: hypothetical protein MJE68_30125 [Proteobacteria bacterium]|nr:hypothetical protein [Pseudomonadota bacterium]
MSHPKAEAGVEAEVEEAEAEEEVLLPRKSSVARDSFPSEDLGNQEVEEEDKDLTKAQM